MISIGVGIVLIMFLLGLFYIIRTIGIILGVMALTVISILWDTVKNILT
jgi:hypothetical protein